MRTDRSQRCGTKAWNFTSNQVSGESYYTFLNKRINQKFSGCGRQPFAGGLPIRVHRATRIVGGPEKRVA